MKRKGTSLLLFFLLVLSGCDQDLMTDSQRFEAVNETFGESGLVFSEALEVPDMPDGAVLVFEVLFSGGNVW